MLNFIGNRCEMVIEKQGCMFARNVWLFVNQNKVIVDLAGRFRKFINDTLK